MSGLSHDFFEGGGALGALMSTFDWAATPLGPPESWPRSLKTTVGILLRSPVPMVLLWGPEGRMIYNDGYARIAAGRHPGLLGSKVLEGWAEVADFNAHVMRVGMAGGTLSYRNQELTLHRNGVPEQVWMNLDYSPVIEESGRPGGVLAIVVETTQHVLAERRVAAEGERLKAMFAQAPGFMALLGGEEHRFEIVNESFFQLVGHRRDVIGRPVREALPELAGQGFLEILDGVLGSGDPFVGRSLPVDLQRRPGAPVEKRYVDLVYQPITDGDGGLSGIFVEGYDVTERVISEEQQLLLLREMNHRVKNLFAIVSGMITVTARNSAGPKEMAATLKGRLEALAVANDLIRPGLIGDGAPAATTDLASIVRTVVEPHVSDPVRFVSEGPAVTVGNRALTSLALFLHETATNAAKYGAFSVPEGRVSTRWRVDAAAQLELDWVERDGPALAATPKTSGFGSLLARRSIEGQLQGRLVYDWDSAGLSIHARLPLEPLQR